MKTASVRSYTGPGRISIARWVRGAPAGYKIYSKLAPGKWFRSVGIEEYLHLYGQMLAKLDPRRTYFELGDLVAPAEPILLCWEVPPFTAPQLIPEADVDVIGKSNWCHRRLCANWLSRELDIAIPELE